MRRNGPWLLFLALGLSLPGCSGGGAAPSPEASVQRTRAQRDSLLSTLPVPGARGVERALEAAGAAGERALQHDTLR